MVKCELFFYKMISLNILNGIIISFTWIASPTCISGVQPLSTSDIHTIQAQITGNLSQAVKRLADDLLQSERIGALFESSRRIVDTRPVTESDVRSLLTELVQRAEYRYGTVESALLDLRDKLLTFLQSPRLHQSVRPHLVHPCCNQRPPTLNVSINTKVGVPVDTSEVCYSRDDVTAGNGFDLWADDVMDTMKTNFKSLRSVLWQEIALGEGLHVQFPSAKRSCTQRGTSNSRLLRPWFRDRIKTGPVNLVLIMDASDSMTSMVFRPGSKLAPLTHWEIAKNAAIELLATLMPWDKVNIVSTGERRLSVPSGCLDSMFVVHDANIEDINNFIRKVVPSGAPDYEASFRQAFQFIVDQQSKEQKTTVGHQPPPTNVILFLTNGDNIITDENRLLQTIAEGQAQIQVYAIQQVFITSLSTWTKVADQNNQAMTVFDGRRNVSALPWNLQSVSGAIGPPGYVKIMEDVEGRKMADYVRGFYKKMNALTHNHDVISFVQEKELQLLTELPNPQQKQPPPYEGIVSINVSRHHIFDDVISFRFGKHSYAFLTDAITGNVVYHPKLGKIGTSGVPWNNMFPNAPTKLVDSIRSSTEQGNVLTIQKIPTGRELFLRGLSGVEQEAFVGHKLVKGTRFVVGVVVFRTEIKSRTMPRRTLQPSGSTAYHRFDLLPNAVTSSCDRNGVQSTMDENTIGINFSPDVFGDASEETVQKVLDMDAFIQRGTYPNSFETAHRDDIELDMEVVNSKGFDTIWRNSTVEQRYFGSMSGVLAFQPASPLASNLDYQDLEWFWMASTQSNTTILTAGQRTLLTLSTTVQAANIVHGVVAASVSVSVLQALLYKQAPICQTPGFVCQIVDRTGCIFESWDVMSSPSSPFCKQNHVTQRYPWLANKLLNANILKPSWSFGVSTNTMVLQYTLQFHAGCQRSGSICPSSLSSDSSSPTSPSTHQTTPECRRFALTPIGGTNMAILILADRTSVNCPTEDFKPGESCDVIPNSGTTPSSSAVASPPPLTNGPPTPPPLPKTPPPLPQTPLPLPQTPPPLPQTPPPLPQTPPPLPQTPPPLPQTPPPLPQTPPPLPQTPPPLPQTPPPLPQTPPPLPKTPPPLPHTPPPLPQTPPPLNNNPPIHPQMSILSQSSSTSPLTPPPIGPPSLPQNSHPQSPPPLPPPFPPSSAFHSPNQTLTSSLLYQIRSALKITSLISPSTPIPFPAHPSPNYSSSFSPFSSDYREIPTKHNIRQTESSPHPLPPLSNHPHYIIPSYNFTPDPTPFSSRKSPQHHIIRKAAHGRVIRTLPPLTNNPDQPIPPYSPPTPSIPKCFYCIDHPSSTLPTSTPQCQVPCYCPISLDKCTKSIRWGNTDSFNIHYDNDMVSSTDAVPQKPASPLPFCPKRCIEISDKTECDTSPKCEWNGVKRPTSTVTMCVKRRVEFTSQSTTTDRTFLTRSNDDDDPSIAIGGSVAGVTIILLLLLVLAWKLSIRHQIFKTTQVEDCSEGLHDGKRYSKDGLIIESEDNG